jgi:hypothetical protein
MVPCGHFAGRGLKLCMEGGGGGGVWGNFLFGRECVKNNMGLLLCIWGECVYSSTQIDVL